MEGFVWREVDRYVVAHSDCCHWKLIRKENEAFSSNWDEWLRWSSYCLDPSAFRAHLEPAWRPSQTFLIKEQRQEDQLKQVKPFKVATNRIRTCSKFNFTQNKTNYSKTFCFMEWLKKFDRVQTGIKFWCFDCICGFKCPLLSLNHGQ